MVLTSAIVDVNGEILYVKPAVAYILVVYEVLLHVGSIYAIIATVIWEWLLPARLTNTRSI